jgi:hypothetical protein
MPDDTHRGLYNKFEVKRVDGKDNPGEKHHGCEYFVLDVTHDKFAAVALVAYANACASEYPELSKELHQGVWDRAKKLEAERPLFR